MFSIVSPSDQVNSLHSTVSACLVTVSFGAPRLDTKLVYRSNYQTLCS